jgi:hypothetical protein
MDVMLPMRAQGIITSPNPGKFSIPDLANAGAHFIHTISPQPILRWSRSTHRLYRLIPRRAIGGRVFPTSLSLPEAGGAERLSVSPSRSGMGMGLGGHARTGLGVGQGTQTKNQRMGKWKTLDRHSFGVETFNSTTCIPSVGTNGRPHARSGCPKCESFDVLIENQQPTFTNSRRRFTTDTIRAVVTQQAEGYWSEHSGGFFMSEEYYDWEIKSDRSDSEDCASDTDSDKGATRRCWMQKTKTQRARCQDFR